MFYLVPDVSSRDLECPGCNMTFDVEWYTEYGDPIFGKHNVTCPICGHKFVMDVDSGITITAIDRRQE